MTSVPLPLPEVLPQLPELVLFAQQAMVMVFVVNCKSLELGTLT